MSDDRPPDLFADGMAAYRQGDFVRAAATWEALLTIAPQHANALQLLGTIYYGQQRWGESEILFRRMLELRPDLAPGWFNLAKVVGNLGRWGEAERLNREGLEREPNDALGWDHLGISLRETGRLAESEAAHRRAVELAPAIADAHNHLGIALAQLGRITEAADAFVACIARHPQTAEAHGNLGNALRAMTRAPEAQAAFERAVALRPEYVLGWDGLLLNAQYLTDIPAAEKFCLHQRYADAIKSGLAAMGGGASPVRRRRASSRLHIGYVSSDLFQHAVAHFLRPILRHHDRARFEISVFSNTYVEDAATAELRQGADHWHSIFGMLDDEAVALIRQVGVDVLVDLNGHSGLSRLGLFARKAAPIQVTYLGYPDTTGLSEIDYRLTDDVADPPGEGDEFHAEKLWRLPSPAWCYQPPADAPTPGLGVAAGVPVTFGCFNNSAKLNPPLLECWAEILRAVPGSRLALKARSFSDPALQARLVRFFVERGIGSERIELKSWRATIAQHFADYLTVDIALDSFPYHGTTTTCDALWMGVPVVTRAGSDHRSRVGVSLLRSVGLGELVASSAADYVALAVALAGDAPRRQALREGMRARLQRSPLLDGPGFARKLEAAYVAMLAANSARFDADGREFRAPYSA